MQLMANMPDFYTMTMRWQPYSGSGTLLYGQ